MSNDDPSSARAIILGPGSDIIASIYLNYVAGVKKMFILATEVMDISVTTWYSIKLYDFDFSAYTFKLKVNGDYKDTYSFENNVIGVNAIQLYDSSINNDTYGYYNDIYVQGIQDSSSSSSSSSERITSSTSSEGITSSTSSEGLTSSSSPADDTWTANNLTLQPFDSSLVTYWNLEDVEDSLLLIH